VSNISGNGSLGISIAAATASDTAGNLAAAAGPASTFSVDNTLPEASSVVPDNTGPTNASSMNFAITFSEAVVNFNDAADLSIVHSGTSHSGVSISGAGTAWQATITGISGNGSFTLAVNTASDVQDTAGNGLASSVTSAAVNIDNNAPSVVIAAPSTAITTQGPVSYTITYSGADTVTLANGDIILNKTGTANGSVAVSGSGTSTRTVTISNISGDGSLGISLAAATASDTAGNSSAAVGPGTPFGVDNTAPGISISAPSPASTMTGPVSYTITYTGANAVTLANGNVTLNSSGSTSGSVNVSGSGNTTRTVTISAITGNGSLGISIAGGTASDTAGNSAPAAGPSTPVNVALSEMIFENSFE
jgi:hypothetical protein